MSVRVLTGVPRTHRRQHMLPRARKHLLLYIQIRPMPLLLNRTLPNIHDNIVQHQSRPINIVQLFAQSTLLVSVVNLCKTFLVLESWAHLVVLLLKHVEFT